MAHAVAGDGPARPLVDVRVAPHTFVQEDLRSHFGSRTCARPSQPRRPLRPLRTVSTGSLSSSRNRTSACRLTPARPPVGCICRAVAVLFDGTLCHCEEGMSYSFWLRVDRSALAHAKTNLVGQGGILEPKSLHVSISLVPSHPPPPPSGPPRSRVRRARAGMPRALARAGLRARLCAHLHELTQSGTQCLLHARVRADGGEYGGELRHSTACAQARTLAQARVRGCAGILARVRARARGCVQHTEGAGSTRSSARELRHGRSAAVRACVRAEFICQTPFFCFLSVNRLVAP